MIRIGFSAGDRLYWNTRAGRYIPYRGSPSEFEDWFAALLRAEQPSDAILLGDGRFYHARAIAALRGTKATAWIVELGYLRPGLLAVESWGMGGRSAIPAAFLRRRADTPAPAPDKALPGSFLRYALYDLGYHGSNLALNRWRYPQYQHHALDSPLREYAGWIGKAMRLPVRRRIQRRMEERIARHQGPLFLFPLQLETDYQIRDHGTGEGLSTVLCQVLGSFAAHAPAAAMLAVKVHPMDNGWARWDRQVTKTAAALGIGGRVAYLDGGRIEDLLPRLAGVVTVNSTVGLSALALGRPCIALGRAIYALPGLTHQTGLDRFWTAPEAPDAGQIAAFLSFLRRHYHIPGTFDGPGARIGAENLARRLTDPPPEYP